MRRACPAFLVIIAIALAAMPPGARAQGPPFRGDTLSLGDAIRIAVDHHPSLKAAEAAERGASAAVAQSRAAYFPQLSASATATRTEGWFVFNPAIAPRQQSYNNIVAGLQVQQLIFDFARTSGRVSAGGDFADAAAFDTRSVRDEVVTNATLAYMTLAQARSITAVNEAAVEQGRRHLTQASAFFSVGRRPRLDVSKAEVDLANANVALIRARNAERTAGLQLENAMGIRLDRPYVVSDPFARDEFPLSLDSIRETALVSRPELQAARGRTEALRALLSAAWAQHLPTLSATGAYNWSGFDFPLRSRWSAGVMLSLPLFQGFGVDAQVAQARANLEAAQASYDLLRDGVLFEVEQIHLARREAGERIDATDRLVAQAEENLQLAEREYAAGVGTSIEVSDARLLLSNARITRIQALYDHAAALVRLRRAMGRME